MKRLQQWTRRPPNTLGRHASALAIPSAAAPLLRTGPYSSKHTETTSEATACRSHSSHVNPRARCEICSSFRKEWLEKGKSTAESSPTWSSRATQEATLPLWREKCRDAYEILSKHQCQLPDKSGTCPLVHHVGMTMKRLMDMKHHTAAAELERAFFTNQPAPVWTPPNTRRPLSSQKNQKQPYETGLGLDRRENKNAWKQSIRLALTPPDAHRGTGKQAALDSTSFLTLLEQYVDSPASLSSNSLQALEFITSNVQSMARSISAAEQNGEDSHHEYRSRLFRILSKHRKNRNAIDSEGKIRVSYILLRLEMGLLEKDVERIEKTQLYSWDLADRLMKAVESIRIELTGLAKEGDDKIKSFLDHAPYFPCMMQARLSLLSARIAKPLQQDSTPFLRSALEQHARLLSQVRSSQNTDLRVMRNITYSIATILQLLTERRVSKPPRIGSSDEQKFTKGNKDHNDLFHKAVSLLTETLQLAVPSKSRSESSAVPNFSQELSRLIPWTRVLSAACHPETCGRTVSWSTLHKLLEALFLRMEIPSKLGILKASRRASPLQSRSIITHLVRAVLVCTPTEQAIVSERFKAFLHFLDQLASYGEHIQKSDYKQAVHEVMKIQWEGPAWQDWRQSLAKIVSDWQNTKSMDQVQADSKQTLALEKNDSSVRQEPANVHHQTDLQQPLPAGRTRFSASKEFAEVRDPPRSDKAASDAANVRFIRDFLAHIRLTDSEERDTTGGEDTSIMYPVQGAFWSKAANGQHMACK